MKVLHVVPHLGGGVGKAHAALRKALGGDIDQTFALLEKPKDTRHSDALKKSGAKVMLADTTQIARWAKDAAIVQIKPTKPMVIENVKELPQLGRFAVRDMGSTIAAGMCIAIQPKQMIK